MTEKTPAVSELGFIGLGVMGCPMARNLVTAGYSLVVLDRNPACVGELEGIGAVSATNPKLIAEQTATIVLMLPDSPDVEEVVVGEDGLLAGLNPGTLVIDMSTISPVATRRLADRVANSGGRWIDAPVSGGDKGAKDGTLSIMVGGHDDDVQRAAPLLRVLGKTIVHVGPVGAGQTVKAANQIVVAGVFQALAEAMNLLDRSNIDLDLAMTVLQGGLAHSRCLEMRKGNYIDKRFDPGFRIELHHKDLGIALDAGRAAGVALPTTCLIREFMGAMISRGQGSLDHSGLFEFVSHISRFEAPAS